MKKQINGLGAPTITPKISINSLVEFSGSTDCRKRTIVKNQKNPPTFMVAYYRTARAAITKYVKEGFDYEHIVNAIQKLQARKVNPLSSDWSKADAENSIIALRRFVNLNFPKTVGKIHCSFSKETGGDCLFEGVVIRIAPDLIMHWEVNGVKYVGAVKFRISQTRWDHLSAGANAASLIAYYLKKYIATEDEVVDPAHCLFVDVMEDQIFQAPKDGTLVLSKLSDVCAEYVELWNKTA